MKLGLLVRAPCSQLFASAHRMHSQADSIALAGLRSQLQSGEKPEYIPAAFRLVFANDRVNKGLFESKWPRVGSGVTVVEESEVVTEVEESEVEQVS